MKHEYAWSPRGELVKDERKGRATEQLNIVAGLSRGIIVAPMMYECSMDSDLFNFWLEYQLLPKIPKNSLVVMDNARFHTTEKTKEVVKKFSCRLLFLPPYSPDLNPIEQFWAFMKAKIKKIADGIKSLSVCVEMFFKTI